MAGEKELSLKGLNADLMKLEARVAKIEATDATFQSRFAFYFDERGKQFHAFIESIYPARDGKGKEIEGAPPLADLLILGGAVSGGVEKTVAKPLWLPVYDEHGDLNPKRKQWHPMTLVIPPPPPKPEVEQDRKLFAEGANEPAGALAASRP